MNNAILRKEKSINLLKSQNIPYIEHLPTIETAENVRIRTKEEIATRALCSLITIQVACDIDNGGDIEDSKIFFRNILESYGILDNLTKKEVNFFEENVEIQDIINMIWKYEACNVLFWSLGIIDSLEYPSHICDYQKIIKIVSNCATFEDFLKKCNLKSINEILDETDLIYRYNWACVNARIHGSEAPNNLDSGVVLERHVAFNWLIDLDKNNDWDNVPTNT